GRKQKSFAGLVGSPGNLSGHSGGVTFEKRELIFGEPKNGAIDFLRCLIQNLFCLSALAESNIVASKIAVVYGGVGIEAEGSLGFGGAFVVLAKRAVQVCQAGMRERIARITLCPKLVRIDCFTDISGDVGVIEGGDTKFFTLADMCAQVVRFAGI